VPAGTTLSDTTPIIYFIRNFFLQFFENVCRTPIVGMDRAAKAKAVRVRLRLRKKSPEVAELIRRFEDCCDRWPDILGTRYAASDFDFPEFNVRDVSNLLTAIVSWASTTPNRSLSARAVKAEGVYQKALGALGLL
jgi:hypothetical protein